MPVTVDIPDMGEVEFPDSMSREEINEASARLYDRNQRARTRPEREGFLSFEELEGITGPARLEPQRFLLPGVPGQLGTPIQTPPRPAGVPPPGVLEDLGVGPYIARAFDPASIGIPRIPRLDLSRYEELTGEAPSRALRIQAGTLNAAAPLLESFLSPGGVALAGAAGLGPGAARTISGGLALETGRHLPEQAVDFYETLKLDLPLEQQVERGLTLGGSALFTVSLGRGAARGGFEGLSRPVSPRELGDYRPIPDADLIAPPMVRPIELNLESRPDIVFPGEVFRAAPGVPILNSRGEVIDVRPRPEPPAAAAGGAPPELPADEQIAERILQVRRAVEEGSVAAPPESVVAPPESAAVTSRQSAALSRGAATERPPESGAGFEPGQLRETEGKPGSLVQQAQSLAEKYNLPPLQAGAGSFRLADTVHGIEVSSPWSNLNHALFRLQEAGEIRAGRTKVPAEHIEEMAAGAEKGARRLIRVAEQELKTAMAQAGLTPNPQNFHLLDKTTRTPHGSRYYHFDWKGQWWYVRIADHLQRAERAGFDDNFLGRAATTSGMPWPHQLNILMDKTVKSDKEALQVAREAIARLPVKLAPGDSGNGWIDVDMRYAQPRYAVPDTLIEHLESKMRQPADVPGSEQQAVGESSQALQSQTRPAIGELPPRAESVSREAGPTQAQPPEAVKPESAALSRGAATERPPESGAGFEPGELMEGPEPRRISPYQQFKGEYSPDQWRVLMADPSFAGAIESRKLSLAEQRASELGIEPARAQPARETKPLLVEARIPQNPVGPEAGATGTPEGRWRAIENTYYRARAAQQALPGADLADAWLVSIRDKEQQGKIVAEFFLRRADYRQATEQLDRLYPATRFSQTLQASSKPYSPRKGEPSYQQWLQGARPNRFELEAPEKPGIVSNRPAEAWADRVIQESQLRLFAGIDPELMAAYVVKGAALFERGTRRFVDWSARMIAQFGDAIRPHLREIFTESQRTLGELAKPLAEEPGETRIRKLSARAAVSPEVPAATQARILSDPASYHERQRMGRIEDRVGAMSNEALAGVPLVQPSGPENFGAAARLELMKRAFASGQDEAAYGILRELSAQSTSFGQLINQLKMLNGANPEHIVKILDNKLGEAGQPPLRPTERVVIQEKARDSIKKNEDWKQAERDWVKNPSDENVERVAKARKQAIQTDLDVQRLIHDVNPRTLPDMLLTLEQLNVMAPISQAANIAGNISFLQLEQGSRTIGTMFDVLDHYLTGRPRELTVSPMRGTAAVSRATVLRAVPDAFKALWKGTSDYELKGEARQPLRPLVAWRDLILAALGRGPEPLRQKGLRLLEASPMAMHAAAQGRMLAAGDIMFRTPAEARLINEAMKLQEINRRNRIRELERSGAGVPPAERAPGLRRAEAALASAKPPAQPGSAAQAGELAELEHLRAQERDAPNNARRAQAMPELFLSPEELARINREAKAAVFQQPNAIARFLLGGLAQASPWLRFALRQLALFIQTPVNIIGRVLAYNPIGAIIETVRYLKAKNTRSAKIAAGRFVLGSMMYGTGAYLASRGLIAPTQSDPDTQQKERLAAGQVFPPGHLNLSGLERLMRGEDTIWHAGDQTRSLLRVGGGGLLLLNGSDLHYSLAEKAAGRTTASEALGQFGLKTLSQTGGYAIQQSFLKGTASMLDALIKGEFDKWFQSMAEGLTAIPLPNTLTAMARAGREFKPEIRGDSMAATLENVFRNRLGAFGGAADELPLKRDLWGRPLRETPEGNLPWVYQMLDVTKAQRIPDDSPALQLYALWRRTGDAAVWPTPPGRSLRAFNRNYPLTREQESRLQEGVGRMRRRLMEALTDNPNWLNAADDVKIEALTRAYSKAHTAGKIQFLLERGRNLQQKPKPAGFR